MKKGMLVFAVVAVSLTMLLIWDLWPIFFPSELHTVDITLEIKDLLIFVVDTYRFSIRGCIPSAIDMGYETQSIWHVEFELGLLHADIDGKSYDAIYLTFDSPIIKPQVPKGFETDCNDYLLGFFTNNSELGDVLSRYGFPHTFVQATYRRAYEGNVNRTYITMTYPNGSLLADITYTIWGKVEVNPSPPSGISNNYYLRDSNLTIFNERISSAPFYIYKTTDEGGIGRLNMTTSEGSIIWRILGRENVMNYELYVTYPIYEKKEKITWIEWKPA